MSHSAQLHNWRLYYSKNCQNQPERSLSASQSLDHIQKYSNSKHYSIFSKNDKINNNNNNIDTSTTRSSSSSTTSGSSCPSYNSLGSKLGVVIFSYQQQCFVHLQSLFTKKHFFNNIVSPCCSCFTTFHQPNVSSTTSILSLAADDLESDRFMASPAGDLSPAPESIIRKNKLSGQLKREQLEREVSMLQNMLNQEEKVHQILEHVHNNQHNGASINIPNSLPPKMKELLAELAMVEGEIARLEGQISELKLGLKHEQEVNKESKAKQWRYGSPIRSVCNPSSFTFPTPVHNNSVQNERIGYETKSLHFISKAIKGDYNVREFSPNSSDRRGNFKAFGDQKENFFHEDKVLQEKVPKKSGILKHSSPMRDPRNPSPKPMRSPGISFENPPKPVSMTINNLEENIQNWHPNKLSEEIMKCMNFIYIRLLRTTRAMELEKSGPITRSLHPSLSSRSFRVEAGSNSRQQDPYGIFNVEECLPRDIGPYKNLVIFTASSMDPKCISSPSSVPLLRKLRLLMSNLQTVELKSLTYQQKLAFWINMYNACIMHGFLQFGVPSTPEKLLTLMNKAVLNIGGNIINAQAIEHYILRKSAPSSINEAHKNCERDDKEATVRELYGLEATEPNVTFALCCGTRSSPAVRMYTAENVTAELERSKMEYLQASVIVTSTKRIALPELLLRNTLDFAADKELLVEWVCHQLPTSGTLRKSIVDCFRTSHNSGRIVASVVDKIAYDFEFQYILAI